MQVVMSNQGTLPDETITRLIEAAAKNASSPEEAQRELAQYVWEEATRTKNVYEQMAAFVGLSVQLETRIRKAAVVAHQTLRKLTYPSAPPEWDWVSNSSFYQIRIIGLERHSWNGYKFRETDIFRDVNRNNGNLKNKTIVKFLILRKGHENLERSIPMRFLNNDPLAVAQDVRVQAKNHALEEYRKELALVENELESLSEKHVRSSEQLIHQRQHELEMELAQLNARLNDKEQLLMNETYENELISKTSTKEELEKRIASVNSRGPKIPLAPKSWKKGLRA
jgi:hypothetical protein